MRPVLPMEPPPLHHTLKALPLRRAARVEKLPNSEIARLDLRSNWDQPFRSCHPELRLMSFRRDAACAELSHLWLRDSSGQLMSAPDAHGVVTVLFSCFVGDNLYAVELEDCAGDSLASAYVEDAGHACLCGECAGAFGECVGILEAL